MVLSLLSDGCMNWHRLLERLARIFRLASTARPAPPASSSPRLAWPTLTERELQVAWCIHQGLTNQEIAEKLYISPGTVKTHVHHLLTKFDLPSRWVLRDALDQAGPEFWAALSGEDR